MLEGSTSSATARQPTKLQLRSARQQSAATSLHTCSSKQHATRNQSRTHASLQFNSTEIKSALSASRVFASCCKLEECGIRIRWLVRWYHFIYQLGILHCIRYWASRTIDRLGLEVVLSPFAQSLFTFVEYIPEGGLAPRSALYYQQVHSPIALV
jgi:hypothetical protein